MDRLKALWQRIAAFFHAQKTTILTAGATAITLDLVMLVVSIIGGGVLGAALAA